MVRGGDSRHEEKLHSFLKGITSVSGNEVSHRREEIIFDLTDSNSLAYCELNYIIATMFRPGAVEFDLFETGELDVKPAHDMVVPLPSLESKGFKVKFN